MDNLQSITDDMRDDLAKGYGGSWLLEHPTLRAPMHLDVSPDGITWLVRLTCGDRVVFDQAVDPAEFVSSLYVFLRWAIRVLTTPPNKPS